MNAVGYYEPLVATIENMYAAQFAKAAYRNMYLFAPDVAAAMEYVESYRPAELPSKWFATGTR